MTSRNRNGLRAGAAAAALAVLLGTSNPVAASAQPALPQLNTPGLPGISNGSSAIPGLPKATAIPGLPTGQKAAAEAGAPQATPYRPDQLARLYPSDAATDEWFYNYVVTPFNEVRANHPEVLDQNLETTVRINNQAKGNREVIELALDDDHNDFLVNLSDGLGSKLGSEFRAALEEGRLPKTKALLYSNFARGGGVINSSFIEKYAYGYDRPFVVAPERIDRYYREGEDDPYSTTPSYPSGHSNKAYWTAGLLSVMMPEFGPQIQARAAQIGQSRLVMGVHYPLDIMGGRMMGTQVAADRWADSQFRPLIQEAADEIRAELEWRCGGTIAECAAKDTPYMTDAAAAKIFTERMTYDFKQIGPKGQPVVVPKRYASLLETRFPQLTEEQRNQVLAATAIESGYPLDRTDGVGQHVRINLARALAAKVTVNADGTLNIQG